MLTRRALSGALCLLLAFPVLTLAQSLVPVQFPSSSPLLGDASTSAITSLPGLNWITASPITIRPTINVGYKRIGFDFSLDIPPTQVLSPFLLFPSYGRVLDVYPLSTKIQSADLAVGTFRLDVQVTPAWCLFGSVSASIPRTVGIEANEGPSIGVISSQAWRWTGSRFQWSEFEVGGRYSLSPVVGLIGGVKFARVSVRLSEPEPVPSYGFFTIFPLPPATRTVTFPDYSGDLRTFLTIPYIGCEVFGPYFKGSLLIGSASARLRLPLELSHASPYITGPIFGIVGRRDLSEQAEYTFKNAGLFLEAGLESTFPISFFNCTVWLKGNWLRIRGDADVNLAGQSSWFILAFSFPEPFAESSSGGSTLNQYSFDLGFSAALTF